MLTGGLPNAAANGPANVRASLTSTSLAVKLIELSVITKPVTTGTSLTLSTVSTNSLEAVSPSSSVAVTVMV
ncbi:hypothetical protein D3C80_1181290 [compost metagenome]